MGNEIRANYNQIHMFPPALEEWVSEDHPARFIRAFVDRLDLVGMGFKVCHGQDGRPGYAADLLLKVWLYGYLAKVNTSRGLERACREHVSLLWLTGMHAPDHNTLWRFWRDNKEPLREVFRRAVKVALDQGMVGMVLHAVDGTKIAADVSKQGGCHRSDLKKLWSGVDEALREMERQVEAGEEGEAGEYRLPEELRDARRLRQAIDESISRLDEVEREHLHPTDEDARMMRGGGKKEFAYNAQVVVDEASGMIVAEEVVNNETDHHCLVPMLEEVESVVGQTAEETVADAGYASGRELVRAEEREYGVVVNLSKSVNPRGEDQEFHSSRFTYDAGRDICICPLGKELTFERTKSGRWGGYDLRVYRCRSFRGCPMREECSRDKRGRMIEIGPYHGAVMRQRLKQQDEKKRALLKKRGSIVESVFGIIKQVMGFRRWTVRGLEKVQTQWALVCTAYNLRKLYGAWRSGKLVLT